MAAINGPGPVIVAVHGPPGETSGGTTCGTCGPHTAAIGGPRWTMYGSYKWSRTSYSCRTWSPRTIHSQDQLLRDNPSFVASSLCMRTYIDTLSHSSLICAVMMAVEDSPYNNLIAMLLGLAFSRSCMDAAYSLLCHALL